MLEAKQDGANYTRTVDNGYRDIDVRHPVKDCPDRAASEQPVVNAAEDTGPVHWPALDAIGLNARQRDRRRGGVGGSDANIIMSGDPDRILRLWREKRDEEEAEDLTGVLPVMLGSWTEAFNRQWYERVARYAVSDCGSSWEDIIHPWRRATLDGIVEDKRAIWEAKHTSAFAKPDEMLERYMPQLQHNMAVAGMENAVLSVIYGNNRWECYEVASDWLYQDELLDAERRFWDCVRSGQPPVAAAPPPAPKRAAYREISFEGNNSWAVAAGIWLDDGDAAKRHAGAIKSLKDLLDDDVSRAYGHGVEAKRSKSGAVTFRAFSS